MSAHDHNSLEEIETEVAVRQTLPTPIPLPIPSNFIILNFNWFKNHLLILNDFFFSLWNTEWIRLLSIQNRMLLRSDYPNVLDDGL